MVKCYFSKGFRLLLAAIYGVTKELNGFKLFKNLIRSNNYTLINIKIDN